MLIRKLKNKITGCGKFLAAGLARADAGLTVRQKKILLLLFCVLFTTVSVWIILATLTRTIYSPAVSVGPLRIPHHIGRNFSQPGAVIDQGTFMRVEHFKQYLDSLKTNNGARYTQIMTTRPHLYDSILAFEKIYHRQSK